MSDNANSHELLSVITSIHHKGVREALDYGALSFTKAFYGVAAGGVRNVNGRAYLNIITR